MGVPINDAELLFHIWQRRTRICRHTDRYLPQHLPKQFRLRDKSNERERKLHVLADPFNAAFFRLSQPGANECDAAIFAAAVLPRNAYGNGHTRQERCDTGKRAGAYCRNVSTEFHDREFTGGRILLHAPPGEFGQTDGALMIAQ